jgi:(p)ppGpp synthase/HD superfamily hydrolase
MHDDADLHILWLLTAISFLSSTSKQAKNTRRLLMKPLSQHTITEAYVARLRSLHLGAAVEPALMLAAERNEGRTRPLSDTPYLFHLVEVAIQIPEVFGIRDETATVVALWHDLLEDDQISRQALIDYCQNHAALKRLGDVMPLLDGLNRHGKTTAEYYDGIAGLPPQAFWVKTSDLLSNTRSMPLLNWKQLKPRWIAKYTVELAREVIDVGRFEKRRGYSVIRSALLEVQQRLLPALEGDPARWHEVAQYDPRFAAAAYELQEMTD